MPFNTLQHSPALSLGSPGVFWLSGTDLSPPTSLSPGKGSDWGCCALQCLLAKSKDGTSPSTSAQASPPQGVHFADVPRHSPLDSPLCHSHSFWLREAVPRFKLSYPFTLTHLQKAASSFSLSFPIPLLLKEIPRALVEPGP